MALLVTNGLALIPQASSTCSEKLGLGGEDELAVKEDILVY
jgi:hypothetical protein